MPTAGSRITHELADLVDRTVYWVDAGWFVPLLGAVEVAIGVGLLLGRALSAGMVVGSTVRRRSAPRM